MKIPRVLGVGTDIVSIDRMLKIISRGLSYEDRFLKKVLHHLELEEYKSHDDEKLKSQFLASRWALKEASVKACGS
jgi:holo-[acyl-carrier protein] synthase